MIIKHVSKQDIHEALAKVQKYFPRISFYNYTPKVLGMLPTTAFPKTIWNVRLYTVWAGASGSLLGVHTRKRSRYACWHSTGLFIDALPQEAVIIANGRRIKPREPWKDWQRGVTYTSSTNNPIMQSGLCWCAGRNSQELFLKANNIDMQFICGIVSEPSRVLTNWDNDVMERFELSRQRYEDGNPINQLITGG